MSKDYSRDLFKQVQELMVTCDNLSQDIKIQKKDYDEKLEKLTKENKELKEKNEKLTNEVDRLKKQINKNSNNSSKPPSSDIKKNIPNNREKTSNKKGRTKRTYCAFLK